MPLNLNRSITIQKFVKKNLGHNVATITPNLQQLWTWFLCQKKDARVNFHNIIFLVFLPIKNKSYKPRNHICLIWKSLKQIDSRSTAKTPYLTLPYHELPHQSNPKSSVQKEIKPHLDFPTRILKGRLGKHQSSTSPWSSLPPRSDLQLRFHYWWCNRGDLEGEGSRRGGVLGRL